MIFKDQIIGPYKVIDTLYEGNHALVIRVMQVDTKKPYILKMPRSEFPNLQENSIIAKEFELLNACQDPHIIRPVELQKWEARQFIVYEDQGFKNLADFLSERPLTIPEALAISKQIFTALSHLKSLKIVHKDLNPPNMVYDSEKQHIYLIDFGNAVRLGSKPHHQEHLEGHLHYLAPEQSGRTAMSIDYRSDQYSAGVSLFQLFTHQLPFNSDSASELIYLQITSAPPRPRELNPNISPLLESLILKMLAKDPRERYQQLETLIKDLDTVHKEYERGSFATEGSCTADYAEKLDLGPSLLGRETELDSLKELLNESPDHSRLILISGPSGLGKSTLLRATQGLSNAPWNIYGSFDLDSEKRPFSAILQALAQLIRQKARSPSHQKDWIDTLRSKVGPHLGALVRLLPEIELLTGPLENPPDLSPDAQKNRIFELLNWLILSITKGHQGLLLRLDNLHHADQSSLDFLDKCLSSPLHKKLTLVAGINLSEDYSHSPGYKWIQKAKIPHQQLTHLVLGPLSERGLINWLAKILHHKPDSLENLSSTLWRLSAGYPEVITGLLGSLEERGLIRYDSSQQSFVYDLEAIKKEPPSSGAKDQILKSLEKLNPLTRQWLNAAAILGPKFKALDTRILPEFQNMALAQVLSECIATGIIESNLEIDSWDWWEKQSPEHKSELEIHFTDLELHRICQEQVSPVQQHEYAFKYFRHFASGLDSHSPPKLYIQVYSYIRSSMSHFKNAEDVHTAIEICLKCAHEALSSVSYDLALQCMQTAHQLYQTQAKSAALGAYEFKIELGLLEASYLAENTLSIDDKAKSLLPLALTPSEKFQLSRVRMQALISLREFKGAIAVGKEALAHFGITLAPEAKVIHIVWELIKTKHSLKSSKPEDLLKAPLITDKNGNYALELLMILIAPAYFAESNLFPVLVFKMVQISIKKGLSPVSAYGFGVYGVLLAGVFGEVDSGYAFSDLSFKLVERLKAPHLKGKLNMVHFSSVHHWKKPIHESLPAFQEGAELSKFYGDYEYVALNLMALTGYSLTAGQNLTVVYERTKKALAVLDDINEHSHSSTLRLYLQIASNLKSTNENWAEINGEIWDSKREISDLIAKNDLTTQCIYHVFSIAMQNYSRTYQNYEEHITKAKSQLPAILGTSYVPLFQFHAGLAYARHGNMAKVKKAIRLLSKSAKSAPENYLHRVHLLRAKLYLSQGKNDQAFWYFEKALTAVSQSDLPHEKALIQESCALHLVKMGQRRLAGEYFTQALVSYHEWGARAKSQQIEKTYGELINTKDSTLALSPILDLSKTISSRTVKTKTSENFDLEFIFETSRRLYQSRDNIQYWREILGGMIHHSGAELGIFVEAKSQAFRTEASLHRDQLHMMNYSFPYSVIKLAFDKKTTIISGAAFQEDQFMDDPIIQERRVKSFLCIPLLSQNEVRGIIYLEQTGHFNAFNEKIKNLTEVVAKQISLSLENANFISELEKRVEERTFALKEALGNLKETQSKLIETEKKAAIGTLVAGVAHEINTPLGVGITVTSKLKYETDLIDQALSSGIKKSQLDHYVLTAKKALQMLGSNLQIIAGQVQQFKNTVVVEQSDPIQEINAEHFIRQTIDSLNTQYPESLIKLEDQVQKDLHFFASPGALTQVIYNLVKNAYNHAFRGKDSGVIVVELSAHQPEAISIRVRDNGIGIEPEKIQNIFEPFFTTSRGRGNMGLGLSITLNLVKERLFGSIEVQSKVGQGTIFTLEIPMKPARENEQRYDQSA